LPDVVICEFMDEAAVNMLEEEFDVLYSPSLFADSQGLRDVLKECRALIVRNATHVGSRLLDEAPRLKVIGRLGVGLDNIELAECKHRGVTVIPATGANSDAVAEYVIAAALLLVRGAFSSSTLVSGGAWPRTQLVGFEVSGKTMGLVGFGDVAQKVAVLAGGLGIRVVANDPYLPADDETWDNVQPVDFRSLLTQSDIISVHIPLNSGTRNLIDAESIAAMKDTAVLINTARGGIIDEVAVVDALGGGKLRGAALDVYDTEPVSATYGASFADVPNLILTPHIAGVTVESNERVSRVTAENVRRALRGVAP